MIMVKKLTTPAEILCRSLPSQFSTYINYCRALTFHERPDYIGLRKLFRKVFFRRGFFKDYIFDWTILNSDCSTTRKKKIESPSDRNSSGKETKASDKSGEQCDDSARIPQFHKHIVKVLEITDYI